MHSLASGIMNSVSLRNMQFIFKAMHCLCHKNPLSPGRNMDSDPFVWLSVGIGVYRRDPIALPLSSWAGFALV